MILDLIALDNSSRVWIYQANEAFSYAELDDIREDLYHFQREWTAHNQELCTYANVFHKRFLAIFVDETQTMASGCSIDASVRFIEQLGAKYNRDFFDRMTYAYMDREEHIHTVHHHELAAVYAEGKIDDNTWMFDNLVKTKGEFLSSWLKPLQNSWHKKFLG